MRRREAVAGARHLLMDAARWQRCERFDGGTQPCLCWFSAQQQESYEAGEWPGGDTGMLADFLTLTQIHDCNKSFNGSQI